MITGQVNAILEARIPLDVEDNTGLTHLVDAVIDTGFTGFLSLPPVRIAALSLSWLHELTMILADGTMIQVDVYTGVVIWDGQARTVRVSAVDKMDPLVGMKLLAGSELRIRVVDGGFVWIDTLP
jgi:clan AA aspartic protease